MSTVFWDVMLCSPVEVHGHFGGTYSFCLLLTWLNFRPWRWMQYSALKHQWTSTRLHGVTFQILVLFCEWRCWGKVLAWDSRVSQNGMTEEEKIFPLNPFTAAVHISVFGYGRCLTWRKTCQYAQKYFLYRMFGCISNCMLEGNCLLGCDTVYSATLKPVAVIFSVESCTTWYHISDDLSTTAIISVF
jgi:hypothetical protein